MTVTFADRQPLFADPFSPNATDLRDLENAQAVAIGPLRCRSQSKAHELLILGLRQLRARFGEVYGSDAAADRVFNIRSDFEDALSAVDQAVEDSEITYRQYAEAMVDRFGDVEVKGACDDFFEDIEGLGERVTATTQRDAA